MAKARANNGRNAEGQFTAGNQAGRASKPHASRVQKLRTKLFAVVTVEEFEGVVRALLREAKKGDVQAARLLCDHLVGKPRPHDDELDMLAKQQQRPFVFQWKDHPPSQAEA